jgi:uncharacterized protein YndB with AHSA1/START domain
MSAPTNEDDRRGELTVSRVVDAPRDLLRRAFTGPEHLAAFWGGPGISVPVESDEYRPMVFPVIVGSGKRLFEDGRALELVDSKPFGTGVVSRAYRSEGR